MIIRLILAIIVVVMLMKLFKRLFKQKACIQCKTSIAKEAEVCHLCHTIQSSDE